MSCSHFEKPASSVSLLLLLLLLIAAIGAPAAAATQCGEWEAIPSPNPVGDSRLEDVDVLAAWDVWAVGSFTGPIDGYWDDRQQSLAMHWNGSAWTIVPTPNPAPNPSTTKVSLEAVSAIASNDVWAVGRKEEQDAGGYVGGRVLAMHWDGFQWTDRNAPWPVDRDGSVFTGASGEQLYDVAALASNDVWMVGRYWREETTGVIRWFGAAIHWNGSGFEQYDLPMLSPLNNQWALSVAAVASNDVWAVGDGNGTNEPAYIWHWNGSAWSAVTAPVPGADRTLKAIVALGPNDIWAGGEYRDAQYRYFPLILHWDGSSWTQLTTPAGGDEFLVFAPDDILTNGVGGWARWDGTSWSIDPGPPVTTEIIRGLATVGPCEAWAVGWGYAPGNEVTVTMRLRSTGGGDDPDGDGVLNESDNCPTDYNPNQSDCDGDGAGDVCELVSGTDSDCNGNSIPDSCESFADCDGNGVPDECQVDCNQNGFPDVCDIAVGRSNDCEGDGVPDECQTFDDCNTNGINDDCDLVSGVSDDTNANGHPDECEALGPGFATVTTPDDIVDFGGLKGMADLPGPDGLVSFREALTAVNNTPGPQTVAFNIPKERWDTTLFTNVVILRLDQGVFFVRDDETTIDFTTQTLFTGDTNPEGSEVGFYGFEPNGWGFEAISVTADRCTVKGLGIVLQRGYGVRLEGNDNRVIASTISGPWYAAVYITGGWQGPQASRNIVGGTGPGEGNFLSAGNDGVRIDGPAADNVVIGNVITGLYSGVSVRAGAVATRIGGPTPAERNVIHGAGFFPEEGCPTGEQIQIENSPSTRIEGNWIGLTADGTANFGQDGTAGISIGSSSGTVVTGNAIGGIEVTGYDHCQGDRFGTAIVLYGSTTGTVIENNLVGTDATGTVSVPNVAGIGSFFFPGAGTPAGILVRQNVIATNENFGVLLGSGVTGGTITLNSIHDNGTLGIDLSGGTANGGQPPPVITSATTDGATITVVGTVSGAANTTFTVETFLNVFCDPSGAGEGELFLGSVSATTDSTGTASFVGSFPDPGFSGDVVTATATSQTTGNTSEFSACETVVVVGSCSGSCLRSTDITLMAKGRGTINVTGRVTVKNESNAVVPRATVYATWTLPGGTQQTRTAVTNSMGIAKFNTSGTTGTYTITVTDIVKTGYTFDAANSVLTKSITK
jgi:hypothetical protein